MSITQGTITLARFLALGPVPDEPKIAHALEDAVFRPFQDGLEEERSGTCDWRNLLLPPDRNWAFQDGKALFGIRIDTRKIPAARLKAHVELRIQNLCADRGLAFVGKEVRLSITDEVKAELLPKQSPTSKVIEVCWDLKKGLVYTSATSKRTEGYVKTFFGAAFGIDLAPLTPSTLAAQLRPPTLNMDELTNGQSPEEVDGVLGPLYLAWLWKASQEEGGANISEDDGTALLFGDSLTLVADEGAVKEANLKKGEPTESPEALTALAKGMRPVAAKLNLKRADLDWVFTFKAGTMLPSSMKIPPSDSKNREAILSDRLFLFEEAMTSLDNRYKAFLEEFQDGGIEGFQTRIVAWAKEARAGLGDLAEEDDSAPWEQ